MMLYHHQVRGPGGNLLQIMNPNQTSHTLNEIYKLCKTDEDFEEEDEDSESLERANELFNSMLKKQVNQSEELLLDISSFHSEYDSLDLSEKHFNDESFKLGTHAFSQVQTMNQINVRHEYDDPAELYIHNFLNNPNLRSKRQLQELRLANKKMKSKLNSKNQSKISLLNQTSEGGENIFDSKVVEEKPSINYSMTKKSFKKPLNNAIL